MIPSPSRLTMCPPASRRGDSTARATCRSSVRVASSPACNDHVEKPTRSVNTNVTSGFAGRRETASVNACHTCSTLRPTSREAASRSRSSRSAARAAARGPPSPAVDNGSPNSGSPGNRRRARWMNDTRPGLRFTVRSQRSADRCRGTGDAMAVAVSSGAPDSESCGPTSTWQG